MKNKQLPLLKVYVVHQCAAESLFKRYGEPLQEHKILGVYLESVLAEQHRESVLIDQLMGGGAFNDRDEATMYLQKRNTYRLGDYNLDPYYGNPYIAVTEHTVRGKQSKLLQSLKSGVNNMSDLLMLLS